MATASSFTIVYEKSEGKTIGRSIAKTFPIGGITRHAAYVIYFYPVT